MENVDLSIIIPTYNRDLTKLLDILHKQIKDNVEVIVIDDHSTIPLKESWFKYIYLEENSGVASAPRNVGLDNAKGKYIVFIDSDDLISDDYIETILEKTKEEWDYCLFSWKTKDATIIIKDNPPKWNCSVWNCIYKKELIGKERFNPELIIAEDYDFNKRVRKGKKANIVKVLYYYNTDTESLMRRK